MSGAGATRVLDARYMAPPEPFEATMAMLAGLQPGETMLLRLFREPHPLYKALARRGDSYLTTLQPDGTFDILIMRAGASLPAREGA